MPKQREYHFDLGNSSVGPIGFCAVVKATSKREAVEILKRTLPTEEEVTPISVEDSDNEAIVYINVYFNEDAITEKDIDDVE